MLWGYRGFYRPRRLLLTGSCYGNPFRQFTYWEQDCIRVINIVNEAGVGLDNHAEHGNGKHASVCSRAEHTGDAAQLRGKTYGLMSSVDVRGSV